MVRECAIALISMLAALLLSPSRAQPLVSDAEARCKALDSADFTGVADAPTRIVSAQSVSSAGKAPAYCKVLGTISSQINFDLRLPLDGWNGKLVEGGCGGWCGIVLAYSCNDTLRRGYACIASDMGHKGKITEVRWAEDNLQGLIDFGYRATHVTAVAGKAIAERFYGKPPSRSYFVGCSTGGYQGVTEAVRFPWDFDGIIAGAPDMDGAYANLRATWIPRVMNDSLGKPLLSQVQLALMHESALALCDRDDGVKDGIIGNPQRCRFDPARLKCKPGETSGCLTAAQVGAAKKLYAGPMNAAGERIGMGGFPVGSELAWSVNWPTASLEEFYRFGIPGYSVGTGWKYTDFDFDRDYKRFGLAAYYENSNPDLRKFKSAGGKLLIYHGWTDTMDLPGPVTDYYETVERTMGGRAKTQDFFRLFMIPGMNHCGGGVGALDVDWLSYLEAWVEEGKAPDGVVGGHRSNAANQSNFSRPVYPYPAYARYRGKGDPNKAESFAPAARHYP